MDHHLPSLVAKRIGQELALISSKGDSTKLRTTPAKPAATGTATVRLGSSPGACMMEGQSGMLCIKIRIAAAEALAYDWLHQQAAAHTVSWPRV